MTTHSTPPPADALRRAKRPASPVAGPYGHPFHPIAVTIPIGSWTAALIFDIVSFVADDPEPFVVGARVLVLIGVIGAVLAAALGLMDLLRLEAGTPARKTAFLHMVLNSVALVLFVVSLIVRVAGDDDDPAVAGFVLALIAFLITGASGWLGGKLAYTYGVRVADESTQAEGFIRGR